MEFSWSSFLNVANELKNTSDEASLRASIGRSYYAVFGEARTKAEKERGGKFVNGMVHIQVIDYFDGSVSNDRKIFATNLRYLKSKREKADYFTKKIIENEAEESYSLAEEMLNQLSAI